jgi:hypothetical protein
VSALAVVISLAYLAIQLKANTRTIKSTAAQEAEELFIDMNLSVATDPETSALLTRAYQAKGLDEFSETENYQIRLMVIAWVQATQAQYFMWREGTLLDEVWDYRLKWFRNWIMVPVVKANWEEIKPEHLFSERFIREVEAEQGQAEFSMGVNKKSD